VRLASLSLAGSLVLAAVVAFALDYPALSGRVVDQANVMAAQSRGELETKLKDLEDKSGIQLVVATVKSLQGTDVETYANGLFRAWKLGQAQKNNGVLLLVAPAEHKVRIEVGYGLEGTLTDALSSVIIAGAIIPRFKAGDFPGGIERGVDGIINGLAVTAPAGNQKSMSDGKTHQRISTNCSRSCSSYWYSLSVGTLFAMLDHREAQQPADGAAVRSLFPTVDRAGARDGAAAEWEAVSAAALAAEAGRQEAAACRGAGDEMYAGGSRCRCCRDPQCGTPHQRPARMRLCTRLLGLCPHPDFVGECYSCRNWPSSSLRRSRFPGCPCGFCLCRSQCNALALIALRLSNLCDQVHAIVPAY